ncbi:MAG: anthranilate phosphoribosyltransferase [Alphaproteobacteria bacterium]|nr:anthranilate phosphoribosyltransferase [Alphaproteobacteria bacterium]
MPLLPIMKDLLAHLATGQALSEAETEAAFEAIMSGEATHAQIGAFLMALRVRGETIDELTGAARIMRAKALTLEAPANAIDTCGTGGDAAGTYNISTAASLIVAACGVPVAKHGNRAQSSRSGSAEVLRGLGVNIDADVSVMAQSLREANIGFMLAPRYHSAMKHVMPVRVELGIRTIFNLLGPLSNPAGTRRQVMGVFSAVWLEPLAEVLGRLGAERAWVVHGADGLDEITTTGPTHVAEYRDGSVATFTITPESVGLRRAKPEDLKGGDAEHNAAAIRALLDGEPGAFRDIALFNAAATLVVADKIPDLKAGLDLATAAVDSGWAKATLDRFIRITNDGAAA